MHATHALSTDHLQRRVEGEFAEMPGLRVTREQAQRLWGLDEPTCAAVLELLVCSGFLTRAPNGLYARTADLSFVPTSPSRMADVGSPAPQTPRRSTPSWR